MKVPYKFMIEKHMANKKTIQAQSFHHDIVDSKSKNQIKAKP